MTMPAGSQLYIDMKDLKKAVFLLILLALPAFIFFVFRTSATNHYAVRRYYPAIDSASGQVKLANRVVDGKELTDTVFHVVPGFSLKNQDGKTVTGQAVKGKIYVADFFFTRCPGICKQMSSQLTRVQETFLNNPSVGIVSFSVDPENDTVAALSEYAARYAVQLPGWQLLTGDKSQIYKLAKYGFFVTAKEDKPDAANIEDQFVHTDKFVLVDKEGRIRGYYNGTNRKDVDRLMVEIKILLKEGS